MSLEKDENEAVSGGWDSALSLATGFFNPTLQSSLTMVVILLVNLFIPYIYCRMSENSLQVSTGQLSVADCEMGCVVRSDSM